jgi:hypothetical protein
MEVIGSKELFEMKKLNYQTKRFLFCFTFSLVCCPFIFHFFHSKTNVRRKHAREPCMFNSLPRDTAKQQSHSTMQGRFTPSFGGKAGKRVNMCDGWSRDR